MSAGTAHRRILLVEDEAIIAMDEQRILASHGYDVGIVHSGEGAVAAVAADHGIELILMDIDLGAGMDGTEAAREILSVRDVPIVFLTSHTEKALVDQVAGITSYGYVVKNSGEFVLVQSIEMAFRLFETTQELRAENAGHRETRESLDESRRFLSSTLEAIQEGISVLEPDLTVRHVNEVMNRWYAENAPLLGKKCYEVYHGRSEPCGNCPTLKALDTGKTEFSVVPGLPGSPVKWVELFAYPMKDPASDEVTGVVEFVRDVSERVEAEHRLEAERERVERLLEERDLLFRESQHRIKNDLALVRSLLSMQASQTADAECRSVLEEAAGRITVMASVHDQLFRHAEVGTVSMAQLIDSLLAELRQGASFSDMDVSVEAEPFSVPARLSVSVGIMLNELLTNAVKHAEQNPDLRARGNLQVRGRIGRREDDSAELSFRDSGTGFPDAVLSGERRGLGLTIIEALAAQHEGEVTFRNDDGAVVEVVLPLPTEAGE
jgi:two-component sensor histidine kinase/CheY-like chemotaxis protein